MRLGDQNIGLRDLKWGLLIAPGVRSDPELDDLLDLTHAELRANMPEEPPDRFEPDDSPRDAKVLALDGSLQLHSIHTGGDVDWVRFDLNARELVQIFTSSPTCDTYLTLYAPDGVTVITEDDDGGYNLDSKAQFTAREAGTYFAAARSFYAEDGTCAAYQLGGTALAIPEFP